jgi:putative membrane protein
MILTTASSPHRFSFKSNTLVQVYGSLFMLAWLLTYIYTPNRADWYTENALTIVCLVLLGTTYHRFTFSNLSYSFFFVYLLLHIYGAQYTYAENPFGYWLKDVLHLERNHYDRIVHFSFGFFMTYPMRDYFRNHFQWPNWVCWVLPAEITLSFSAAYELIEWLVADIFFKSEGVAYLGTQGDAWDAQKDMGLAFSGAVISLLLVATIKRINKRMRQ